MNEDSWKTGTPVKLVKFGEASGAKHPTPDWSDQHKEGNTVPLFWEVRGHIYMYPPKVGQSLFLLLNEKNGLKDSGIFNTSIVRALNEVSQDILELETINSKYVLVRTS